MKMKRRHTRWYYCKHCNKRWKETYLADLCFKIDMDNIEREKQNLPKIKMK